jgi:hypothetical protein
MLIRQPVGGRVCRPTEEHPRSFVEKTSKETLRPSARRWPGLATDGLRVTGRRRFTFFGNATLATTDDRQSRRSAGDRQEIG